MCAVLGPRALYFLLAGASNTFRWLKLGLSIVLVFVGTAVLLEHVVHVPVGLSLGVIGTLIIVSITESLLWPASMTDEPIQPPMEGEPPPLGSLPPDRDAERVGRCDGPALRLVAAS